jgi:hypothetical protein
MSNDIAINIPAKPAPVGASHGSQMKMPAAGADTKACARPPFFFSTIQAGAQSNFPEALPSASSEQTANGGIQNERN